MTFRDILTWPLRQIDRLNPLAAGSGYMLRHFPTLWRVSVLKIIWYLFLAHVAVWWAGWWAAQALTHLPTIGEMLSFRGTIIAVAVMIGFAWVVSVWQTPLIRRSMRTLLLTWLVYAGFIYGLATITQAYVSPMSHKVAQLYDGRYLRHDTEALANPFAHICRAPGAADPRATVARLHGAHPDHPVLAEIVTTFYEIEIDDCNALRAVRFSWAHDAPVGLGMILGDLNQNRRNVVGSREPYRAFLNRVDDRLAHKNLPSFQVLDHIIASAHLDGRMAAATLAHATTHPRRHMHYLRSVLRPGTALFAGLLAAVLLVLELFWRRWLLLIMGPLERMRARRRERPGLISRANARFLRTRPVMWQLRLPAATILMVLIVVFGWVAVDFSETLIDWMESIVRDRIDGDAASITVVIVYILVLVGVAIALMQVQRRYFQLDLRRPGAGAQFFLALFLPVLAACLIGSALTALQIGDDATGNGVVWYAAAVFAYMAATFSWSQTFLGLRQAIVLATVFAAFCGAFAFVATVISLGTDEINMLSMTVLAAVPIVWILGLIRGLGWLRNGAAVTLLAYALFFSTVGVLVVIEEHFRNVIVIDKQALVINIFFLLLALMLMPLFNRLQELATAPKP